MNDQSSDTPRDHDPETGAPVTALASFALEDDPSLPGRVRRSIVRRVLVSESLEFSLDVLVRTLWGHIKAILELLPVPVGPEKETSDE